MAETNEGSHLDELSKRLDKARAEGTPREVQREDTNKGIGAALRMATEFVVAVIVGGAIGWYLDGWLGTKPWLMILFFLLGVGAGFLNVFRAAAAIAADDKSEE